VLLEVFALALVVLSFAIPFFVVRGRTKRPGAYGLVGVGLYVAVGWLVRWLLSPSGDSLEDLAERVSASKTGMGFGLLASLAFAWIARARLGSEASEVRHDLSVPQLAGTKCSECSSKIVSGAEAKRCKRCGEPIHKKCSRAHRLARHARRPEA
jgi:hypothetical protein